ncbi:MAG: class I SAM-dependent methyltransferase [Acidobacteriota bacterium]
MLSREQAKAFYDRLGSRQDSQAFYEDVATENLIAHADFESAHSVLEFGCGTGRFAEKILDDHLLESATYRGLDLSSTMVALASRRIARFGARAQVLQTDGPLRFQTSDGALDRIVSNYVLDLLPVAECRLFVREARRSLSQGGRLCLCGLTFGNTLVSRLVTAIWIHVHALRPALVGGCRPVDLLTFLPGEEWNICHCTVKTAFGMASQIVVATPRRLS